MTLHTAARIAVSTFAFGALGVALSYQPGTLPDPNLTPGTTNPAITQNSIGQTICNPHWFTHDIRPTSSYTTKLKKAQIAAVYGGYATSTPSAYEEDHLISLELGGNPTDPGNLWPEPYDIPLGARQKDKVENWLHKQVCEGTMTLAEAQHAIRTNWTLVYVKAFGEPGDNDELL